MFWEILKASKGLPVTDQYAALWGQKIAGGWKVTEITGELPLIFLSDGSVLVDYRIYGTSEGAGVETESGEPTGYKLPMTVESGEESTDTPIYIGDSKLMAEEYVDYEEQKVYKYAEPLKIYGWHVDPSISDPANAITYLGDAVGKTPAAMGTSSFSYGDWLDAFFMPKPCMLKFDGTVDYYLDPNDYSKKADGTPSDIADPNYDGNAMMEWPLIWYKFESLEDKGYRAVEYLKSTGTQCIQTDILPDINMEVQFDGKVEALMGASTKIGAIFGATNSTAGFAALFYPPKEADRTECVFYWGFAYYSGLTGNSIVSRTADRKPFTDRNIYTVRKGFMSIGNQSATVSTGVTANSLDIGMGVFGRNNTGTLQPIDAYNVWCYGFKIYKNNELIHNLIPVERKTDSELGLYDVITNKFYTNAGTGTFEKGSYVDGHGYFYVANRKPDDSYHCWCNYDADDNITEHFYTAIYNGTGTSKMRSISGVTLTSANGNGGTTATQEITRATANNATNKTEWYIDVWSDRMLINGLLILMGKSLNSQAVFGRGLDTGSQSAKEAYVTGSLNDKGLFWGNTSAGTSGVKVFGMENYWGCAWRRTAGLIGLSNGNTAYKLTYGTADGTTADGYNTNGNGYLVDTTARPANGYFKTAKFGKFGYLPLTTGGSSTTYFADYWYTNNSALTFALVGGNANVGVYVGCSFFYLGSAPGLAYWHISSSLSFKPLAKTTPEPELIPTDPPVPLPPIPTYKGENTLSSTETLGEVTVRGRIKQPTYRQVEYLKSTGTQYIQTDIIPANNTKIKLDMQFGDFREYANASTYNSYFCGVAEFSGDATSEVFWGVSLNELSGSTSFDFYLGNVSWRESTTHISNPANITTRQTMQICRGNSYWGNQTALVNAAVTKAEPTKPLAIMGFNCVDRPDFSPNPYKCRNLIIYGAMIYLDGSELSHNLIPVERKDGELGLLDTITNKFYANAGTGTFEKGDYI